MWAPQDGATGLVLVLIELMSLLMAYQAFLRQSPLHLAVQVHWLNLFAWLLCLFSIPPHPSPPHRKSFLFSTALLGADF